MSSRRYATPLRVELRPSRLLAAGLAIVHGGAAGLVWTLPWAWGWCAVTSSFILGVGILSGARHLWGGSAVVALTWGSDGRWLLERRDGVSVEAGLLPESYVHPRLTILRLGTSSAWRRHAVVLLPDALDAEAFRRLRVRLRLEGAHRDASLQGKRP